MNRNTLVAEPDSTVGSTYFGRPISQEVPSQAFNVKPKEKFTRGRIPARCSVFGCEMVLEAGSKGKFCAQCQERSHNAFRKMRERSRPCAICRALVFPVQISPKCQPVQLDLCSSCRNKVSRAVEQPISQADTIKSGPQIPHATSISSVQTPVPVPTVGSFQNVPPQVPQKRKARTMAPEQVPPLTTTYHWQSSFHELVGRPHLNSKGEYLVPVPAFPSPGLNPPRSSQPAPFPINPSPSTSFNRHQSPTNPKPSNSKPQSHPSRYPPKPELAIRVPSSTVGPVEQLLTALPPGSILGGLRPCPTEGCSTMLPKEYAGPTCGKCIARSSSAPFRVHPVIPVSMSVSLSSNEDAEMIDGARRPVSLPASAAQTPVSTVTNSSDQIKDSAGPVQGPNVSISPSIHPPTMKATNNTKKFGFRPALELFFPSSGSETPVPATNPNNPCAASLTSFPITATSTATIPPSVSSTTVRPHLTVSPQDLMLKIDDSLNSVSGHVKSTSNGPVPRVPISPAEILASQQSIFDAPEIFPAADLVKDVALPESAAEHDSVTQTFRGVSILPQSVSTPAPDQAMSGSSDTIPSENSSMQDSEMAKSVPVAREAVPQAASPSKPFARSASPTNGITPSSPTRVPNVTTRSCSPVTVPLSSSPVSSCSKSANHDEPAPSSSPIMRTSSAQNDIWDDDLSDLTPLEDSTDEGESEIDPADSDHERSKAGKESRGETNARPPSSNRRTVCCIGRCSNLLPPRTKWKMCESCRIRNRNYQRKRLNVDKHYKDGPDSVEAFELDAAAKAAIQETLQGGFRVCTIKYCENIIPPPSEYRWKMCEPCRTRTRTRARKRSQRDESSLTVDVDAKCSVGDGKSTASALGVKKPPTVRIPFSPEATSVGKTDSKMSPQAVSTPSDRYPVYQSLSFLLEVFHARLSSFLQAHVTYLRFKLLSNTASDVDPMLFTFDGEYSVVADPAGGEVASRIHNIRETIEKSIGTTFRPNGTLAAAEGVIIGRFGCIHEMAIPMSPLNPSKPVPNSSSPNEKEPQTLNGVMVKRMAGELEVTVSWDRRHQYFPGLRTVIRFRLVG